MQNLSALHGTLQASPPRTFSCQKKKKKCLQISNSYSFEGYYIVTFNFGLN